MDTHYQRSRANAEAIRSSSPTADAWLRREEAKDAVWAFVLQLGAVVLGTAVVFGLGAAMWLRAAKGMAVTSGLHNLLGDLGARVQRAEAVSHEHISKTMVRNPATIPDYVSPDAANYLLPAALVLVVVTAWVLYRAVHLKAPRVRSLAIGAAAAVPFAALNAFVLCAACAVTGDFMRAALVAAAPLAAVSAIAGLVRTLR